MSLWVLWFELFKTCANDWLWSLTKAFKFEFFYLPIVGCCFCSFVLAFLPSLAHRAGLVRASIEWAGLDWVGGFAAAFLGHRIETLGLIKQFSLLGSFPVFGGGAV